MRTCSPSPPLSFTSYIQLFIIIIIVYMDWRFLCGKWSENMTGAKVWTAQAAANTSVGVERNICMTCLRLNPAGRQNSASYRPSSRSNSITLEAITFNVKRTIINHKVVFLMFIIYCTTYMELGCRIIRLLATALSIFAAAFPAAFLCHATSGISRYNV